MSDHAVKLSKIDTASMGVSTFRNTKSTTSGFRFPDNRPEAVAQRNLQQMANDSRRLKRIQAFQDTVQRAKSKSVVQGYFTHLDVKLGHKESESIHGWAHVNLNGNLKSEFFRIYNDKNTSERLEDWFTKNNLSLDSSVLKHLSYESMSEIILRKSELISRIEYMYQDAGQSAEEISGIMELRNDIINIDHSKSSAFAYLQGYEFQLEQIIKFTNQSKYIETDGADVFKPKVKAVESKYIDHQGMDRWADIELNDSDDEGTSYVEVKAMSSTYDPEESEKEKFRRQAEAYSKSGKNVTYIFKNKPPSWAEAFLNQYRLEYKITG